MNQPKDLPRDVILKIFEYCFETNDCNKYKADYIRVDKSFRKMLNTPQCKAQHGLCEHHDRVRIFINGELDRFTNSLIERFPKYGLMEADEDPMFIHQTSRITTAEIITELNKMNVHVIGTCCSGDGVKIFPQTCRRCESFETTYQMEGKKYLLLNCKVCEYR
jgi:hypothetical protein